VSLKLAAEVLMLRKQLHVLQKDQASQSSAPCHACAICAASEAGAVVPPVVEPACAHTVLPGGKQQQCHQQQHQQASTSMACSVSGAGSKHCSYMGACCSPTGCASDQLHRAAALLLLPDSSNAGAFCAATARATRHLAGGDASPPAAAADGAAELVAALHAAALSVLEQQLLQGHGSTFDGMQVDAVLTAEAAAVTVAGAAQDSCAAPTNVVCSDCHQGELFWDALEADVDCVNPIV
jgi:hypothetical protein